NQQIGRGRHLKNLLSVIRGRAPQLEAAASGPASWRATPIRNSNCPPRWRSHRSRDGALPGTTGAAILSISGAPMTDQAEPTADLICTIAYTSLHFLGCASTYYSLEIAYLSLNGGASTAPFPAPDRKPRERTFFVKERTRQSCPSGTARGEGGKVTCSRSSRTLV